MTKLKTALLFALLSIGALVPETAHATVWCQGTINYVWVHKDGGVYILPSWRGEHIKICSLTSTYKGVAPVTCNGWLAVATLAYKDSKQSVLAYEDPAVTVCGTVPSYDSAPTPNYVMVRP